jgi:DNA helicase-2/ATP-dependent DNA helicase PcrA
MASTIKEKIMINLNREQQAAAEFLHGVASVVAVPGSGKTLTMTRRIANLVEKGVAPENILGLTFTRNAAMAMRKKLEPVLEGNANRVTLATIHSFCYSMLKNEGVAFELLTGKEQLRFIKKILSKLKIKNVSTGVAVQEINTAQSNMISVQDLWELYNGDPNLSKFAQIYDRYEQEKSQRMLMDFNDLLKKAFDLLNQSEDLLERYHETYRHILVDEFQDTNPAQMALINLLAGKVNGDGRSFWVCGDDSQSIYSFTGASVGNILNFQDSFPGSKMFVMETNYRSTPQILSACQNLIQHNVRKIEKTLRTDNVDGDNVTVISTATEEDEAVQVVNEIIDLVLRRGFKYWDIAILYRANSQSRVIEETLTQAEVPYHIENGINFYQRFEVKILLDYMRLIINPHSEEGNEAFRSIINVPNRYIGQRFISEVEAYADANDLHLYQGLKQMPVTVPYLKGYIRDFIALLDPLVKDAAKLEPSELIYILREALDYDHFIAEDDIPSPDDSKIANINQLQIAANNYGTIPALLTYTDSFTEELSHDKDGVSLMTIHKAKGLEFPVVFVIGMVEGMLPNKQGDIEEERRVAFVGLSRAMHHLYLTYSRKHLGRDVKKSIFIDEALMGNQPN